MTFLLTSTAFKEGEKIPVKYTGEDHDLSPQLTWSNSPSGTKTFVLIVDDPDAPGGVFTHWVLFNLPGNISQLPEGIPNKEKLQNGAIQGKNTGGTIGYMGPYPPHGPAHRYCFTIYAVDKQIDLKPGVRKEPVLASIKGHILAQAQLTGIYQR